MENKTEFKPYIPASKITPEITVTSIVMGIILAVVFGAANAYLGLRVGMTVSASIRRTSVSGNSNSRASWIFWVPAPRVFMGPPQPGHRSGTRWEWPQ